jgi:hypothetical protein
MKTIKLLIIAMIIVGTAIGISQLGKSGGGEPPIGTSGTVDSINSRKSGGKPGGDETGTAYNEISAEIKQIEQSGWNKELYEKKYIPVANRIKACMGHEIIDANEAQTLSDNVEIVYIGILIKAVEDEIADCKPENMKQLKLDLDKFAGMGRHNGISNFKETVQNMSDYMTTQNFVNEVSNLRNKTFDSTANTKFPDTRRYHERADELRENIFVAQCSRLQASLVETDKRLCEAHHIFLDKKVGWFIKKESDFDGINDENGLNEKFKSIEQEIDTFFGYSFYPYTLKKNKYDLLIQKLETKKNNIRNNFK